MSDAPIVLERRTLAYLDVLGAAALARAADQDSKSFRRLYRACRFGGRFKELVSASQQALDFPSETMRVSTFSDLVAMSVECRPPEVFALVLRVIMHFSVGARFGIFYRGAIVVGMLTHTEDLVFGEALVDAHEQERCQAKVPRVLVAEEIPPLFRAGLHEFNKMNVFDTTADETRSADRLLEKIFLSDDDGRLILNTFHGADLPELQVVHKITRDRLRSLPAHQAKYEWLKRQVERQLAVTVD